MRDDVIQPHELADLERLIFPETKPSGPTSPYDCEDGNCMLFVKRTLYDNTRLPGTPPTTLNHNKEPWQYMIN